MPPCRWKRWSARSNREESRREEFMTEKLDDVSQSPLRRCTSMVSGWFSARITTDDSLISRQRILILPDGVATSASSPTAIVRLLMRASRSFCWPERPLRVKEAAEIAGAALLVTTTTGKGVRVERGKKGSLTGFVARSNMDWEITSFAGVELVPSDAGEGVAGAP